MNDTVYALWLMPSDPDAAAPAAAIRRYSRALSTPAFEPHITLVSGLHGPVGTLEAKAVELAAGTAALHVDLGPPAHSEAYFRCVYLPVQPEASLLALHARACDLLGTGPQPPDSPHLSLIYGNLPPQQRQAIAAEIGESLSGPIVLGRLCLYRASSASPPEAWQEIRGCNLGRPPGAT